MTTHKQLNKNPQAVIDAWETRTEAQWKELYGIVGVVIYNHLHPPIGSRLLSFAKSAYNGILSIDVHNHIHPRIGSLLLQKGFPPLGRREISHSESKTRTESVYELRNENYCQERIIRDFG